MMPHLAPQSRQRESPEIRPAQVLQEEVEKMIRSGQEPSTTKIKDIEKLVSGEILPELQGTHSMAQMDITMMSHAASATNKKTYQELQTTKHTMEVQVMHARDALSNCRTAEAPLNASKVLHCSERDRFQEGIELPASLPIQRSPALMGPYLDAMSTYFYPKHDEFVKLDTTCINATSVYDVHRSSCNMKQAQYEVDFCTWRTRMTDICMVASHTYAHAVATYRSKEASTKVLVQKMKTEYTAIKKILCYINVWLSDSNTSTANQTILEACNMSAVDTSPMDISYPGVPCATTCDISATAAFPGTEAFAAGYANYSQAPATITPCMAEGSAANGMLSLLNERTRKATACPGGHIVNGESWFIGSAGQTCDSVCGAQGGTFNAAASALYGDGICSHWFPDARTGGNWMPNVCCAATDNMPYPPGQNWGGTGATPSGTWR